MTSGAMALRVRNNVEDPNADLYSVAAVEQAINESKDEVLSLVRIFTDQFPQSTTAVTFSVGTSEVALPSDFLEPLKLEYTPTGSSVAEKRRFVDFRRLDDSEDGAFSIRRVDEATAYLRRANTDSAFSATLYYVPNVSDLTITTTTTTSFSFGPAPTNNLIVIKATVLLLSQRKKREQMVMSANREDKVQAQLQENLSRMYNKATPRYVNYIPDC